MKDAGKITSLIGLILMQISATVMCASHSFSEASVYMGCLVVSAVIFGFPILGDWFGILNQAPSPENK